MDVSHFLNMHLIVLFLHFQNFVIVSWCLFQFWCRGCSRRLESNGPWMESLESRPIRSTSEGLYPTNHALLFYLMILTSLSKQSHLGGSCLALKITRQIPIMRISERRTGFVSHLCDNSAVCFLTCNLQAHHQNIERRKEHRSTIREVIWTDRREQAELIHHKPNQNMSARLSRRIPWNSKVQKYKLQRDKLELPYNHIHEVAKSFKKNVFLQYSLKGCLHHTANTKE